MTISGYDNYRVTAEGVVYGPRGKLSPVLTADGYETVRLYANGCARRFRVSRLVCEAFNGPPNILHTEVAHLNGKRRDNRAANLKWVSKAENAHHRHWHGTHPGGENHPRAKLTAADVEAIRGLLRSDLSCTEIGRRFGVHNTTIQDIKRGRKWRQARSPSSRSSPFGEYRG